MRRNVPDLAPVARILYYGEMLNWIKRALGVEATPTLPLSVVKKLYVSGHETGLLLGYEDGAEGATAARVVKRSLAEGLRLGASESEKVLSLAVITDDVFAEARRSGLLPVSVARSIYVSGFRSGYTTGAELGHLDAKDEPMSENALWRFRAKGDRLGKARAPSDFDDALRKVDR